MQFGSQHIKNLKRERDLIQPDPLWVKKNKEMLFSTLSVQAQKPKEKSSFLEWISMLTPLPRTAQIMRTMSVSLLVMGLTVSTWIAGVDASYNSLPGEGIKYRVKLAIESIEVVLPTVTGDSQTATRKHLEHASRRAEELVKVSQKNPDDASTAIKRLNSSIESANKVVQGEDDPTKAVGLAKDFSDKTKAIVGNLDTVKNDQKEGNPELAKVVGESKKKVLDTNLDVLTEAVKKAQTLEGTKGAVAEAVTEAVGTALEQAGQTVLASQESQNATSTSEVVKQQAEGETIVGAVPGKMSSSTATTTIKILQTSSSTGGSEIVVSQDLTKLQTGEVAAEVDALIAQENFLEAIEKVKEISAQADKITQGTQGDPQILPQVKSEMISGEKTAGSGGTDTMASSSSTSATKTSTPAVSTTTADVKK